MNLFQTLHKKVAIVTGGARGIGKGISLKLMEERYHVIIADKDEDAGQDIMEGYGKVFDIEFVPTDVADWNSVKQLLNHVATHHGRVDALVNNAADAKADNNPLEDLEQDEWQTKIATNLGSIMACAKHFARMLIASRGSIVNIASTRAQMSEPNTESYSASKGGVVALTHALANSLGPEVRVNAVSPGWIEVSNWQHGAGWEDPDLTRRDHLQHPVGRVGTPNDVANIVTFLLSERAGFITGQNFVIDGGMTRKMIYED